MNLVRNSAAIVTKKRTKEHLGGDGLFHTDPLDFYRLVFSVRNICS